MPTIVSFYQRFPNEAPPLNLSAFDHTGYTYAENFRRNERCYEAEQCEVTSGDGSVVLSLDVRIRPRGGEIEALPRVMLSVYSEGMPFQVCRMELRTGGTTYAILPDTVQQYTMRDDRVTYLTAHHFGHGLANLVLLRHDCLAYLRLRQILDGLVDDGGVKLGNQLIQHGGVVAGGQRRHFDAQRIQPRSGQLCVRGIQHSGKQLRRAVVERSAVAA